MAFEKLKKALGQKSDVAEEEYLEIDLEKGEKEKKVIVKPFVLKTYEDTNEILNSIRDGFTIAIVDIRVLRQKDSIELKRAISKIKKTVDALEGSIAGFGENMIIATPSFATIHREVAKPKEETRSKFDL
jgi:SepF-like predicted cell division protein (DUF552 family)